MCIFYNFNTPPPLLFDSLIYFALCNELRSEDRVSRVILSYPFLCTHSLLIPPPASLLVISNCRYSQVEIICVRKTTYQADYH